MTPECCKDCRHLTPTGACALRREKKCASRRAWFRAEWSRIRRAAELLKIERGG